MLPRAMRYGAAIGRLPFVRMVALSGSLAAGNPAPGADYDYFIVTAPGRLWLCRALIILWLRGIYRRYGDTVCPNFLITSDHLELRAQNLYAAHELAQMLPLNGAAVYARLRRANPWAEVYLPNAAGPPPLAEQPGGGENPGGSVYERLLSLPPFDVLESWEQKRKIRRFTRQADGLEEVYFSANWCQGHFDGYAQRTLQAYAARLEQALRRLAGAA
jgi:hypothetical protein